MSYRAALLLPRRLLRVVALPKLGAREAGVDRVIGHTQPVIFPADVFEVCEWAQHFDVCCGARYEDIAKFRHIEERAQICDGGVVTMKQFEWQPAQWRKIADG